MADTFSRHIQLRLMRQGSHMNTWGHKLNDELEKLDAAIGQVCTRDQIATIRALMGNTTVL